MKNLTVRPLDRASLGTWLLSWLGVAWFSVVIIRVIPRDGAWPGYLTRWSQWDVDRFHWLAVNGYGGPATDLYPVQEEWPAFFPGFPLMMRFVGFFLPWLDQPARYQAAGLIISAVAGAVAMLFLARLAAHEVGGSRAEPEADDDARRLRQAGIYAVVAILVSPAAVFLFAAYSEALFLALALPAWLLAKKGRWEPAVLCAAGATCVRVTGLFLAAALVVEYLVGQNGRRRGWRAAPLLIVPVVPFVLYTVYQWRRTGDWMAWQHAQEIGWHRTTTAPWESFKTTWTAAFVTPPYEFTNAFRVEIVAALVGVLLLGWLLARRQWPEATYIGLQLVGLLSSQFYLSIGRATLVWFPLWIALGHLAVRHRGSYFLYVALALPVMAAFVMSFTQGQWTG